MSVWSTLGTQVANLGGALNLPEFGLSERINSIGAKPTQWNTNNPVNQQVQQANASGNPITTSTIGRVLGAQTVGGQQYNSPIGPQPQPTNNPSSGGNSAPDLSNPGKMTEYARSQGYNGWDEYQNALNANANRESQLRGTIESGFNDLKSGYQNLIPYYQQEEQRRLGAVGDTYNTVFQGLGQAKQAGFDKLGNARQEVQRRSAESVQDLKQNLNQVMRNTGMQLGAMGAGDTSASQVMAPYAYTKMAGQEFGNISRQSNDQFGQLDQKEVELEQEYAGLYNQTELEKSSQMESIRQDVGAQIARIREMIPQVDAQRAQALAGLEQSLLQNAQSQLMQIQAEDRQRKDSLQQWALQRVAQLNDAKISLQNTANFSPEAITYNEMESAGGMPAYGQDTEQFYNPLAFAQKRRQELGLQ